MDLKFVDKKEVWEKREGLVLGLLVKAESM